MGNIVQWGTYEVSAAEAEAEDLAKSGKSNFLKFDEGKTIIRFLPPALGKKSPFRIVWQHGLNAGGQFRSVACPQYEAKKPCPICAKAQQLKGSTNPADQERASEFFARRRVFANVINRMKPEDGVQVAGFGKTVHEALIALRTDPDAGGDYTHPDTGFDIVIERSGKGKNDTEYKVLASRKVTPLGNNAWIGEQVDLDQFAKLLTPDEMREAFTGKKPGTSAPAQQERVVNAAPAVQRSAPASTIEHDSVTNTVNAGSEDVPF